MGTSPKGDTITEAKANGVEFHQGKQYFGKNFLKISDKNTLKPIKIAPPGSIVMSVRAPVGDCNITNREIAIGRGLCSINAKEETTNKFLYYYISAHVDEIKAKSLGATFESVNSNDVKKINVLLPPLEIQEKIVDILDRFNAYANGIDEGLPKEIELNNLRYEYYRDKLLTFPKKKEDKEA